MLHMLARALADHSQDNVCLRRATQEAGLGLGGSDTRQAPALIKAPTLSSPSGEKIELMSDLDTD